MKMSVEVRDADLWRERKLEVEIYLDRGALEELVQQLQHLKEPGDHCHFMTPTWGGKELQDEPHIQGNVIADHMKITLVE